ncbi:alpha/beta-hydrolase [Clavulina sp. PMI_390]|nr:alpha/beta-hydrolase [Clavulina sp. PMI_390]
MPRVPYQFIPPGQDPIADRVRERRGVRGLTPLDATLLNAPGVADAWNKLLGTLRTQNSLSDDIKELMILRIAVLNNAAFEWIQHEQVGRAAGLTTAKLVVIQDTTTTESAVLTPLERAALAFTDASTIQVRVPDAVYNNLKQELQAALAVHNPHNVTIDRQMVEATATVGGYNLVSRFLVALDVDDRASQPVPKIILPPSPSSNPLPPAQEYPVWIDESVTLHARAHFHPTHPAAPTVIFINSLLTNTSMWDRVLPAFAPSYTLITFDQRGHGHSSSPPSKSTIPRLAEDVARVLDYFQIKQAHGVVGVSQGGATALAFALAYPKRVRRLVACDTQAKSPAANKAAWDERIALARSGEDGMSKLASATAGRWFPAPGSSFAPGEGAKEEDFGVVRDMIQGTSVEGFAGSAAALQDYDLLGAGLIQTLQKATSEKDMKVLLLAGELDGKLPAGLKALRDEIGGDETEVGYVSVKGSGHLPMLDNPKEFGEAVSAFLAS